MFDALLNTSPGRVPKSSISPLAVHRTACIGQPVMSPGPKDQQASFDTRAVVDQPTICPKSFTPFAELLKKSKPAAPPNHSRSVATPFFHDVACPEKGELSLWPTIWPVLLTLLANVGGQLPPNKAMPAALVRTRPY